MAVACQLDVDARAVLVIGGRLPPDLVLLKTMLRIEVVEGVRVPECATEHRESMQEA
jgi:hypothetical protein